jgi:hypothetical protein
MHINDTFADLSTTIDGAGLNTVVHYDMAVICLNDIFVPADLHVYGSTSDGVHPDHSVAFVIWKICIKAHSKWAIIVAIHPHTILGDVVAPTLKATYEDAIWSFTDSHMDGVATVSGQVQVLKNCMCTFPIDISQHVHFEMKEFQLMYVFSACFLCRHHSVLFSRCLFDGDNAAKSVIFSRSERETLFDKYSQKRDGPIRVMVI